MKRRSGPACMMAVALAALVLGSPTSASDQRKIDGFARRALQEWQQPGLALAVVERGSATLVHGYGLRDRAAGAAITPDTLFAIGSCSKAFAAADIAKLAEQKRLSLDDRVEQYLPWFRTSDPWLTREIRIRDLLAHRTGLHAAIPRESAPDKLTYLKSIALTEPWHPLRAQFSYTNDAYTLAGELVAEIMGREWEDYTREEFWRPLGMTRTNADHRRSRGDPNSATPYVMKDGRMQAIRWIYEDRIALPSGGMNSTANDMARWLQFQLSGTDEQGRALLARASLDEMHTEHTPLRGDLVDPSRRAWGDVVGRGPGGIQGESYAMGWFIHYYRGYRVLAHPGAISGFRCYMAMLPERGFAAVVLLNSESTMLALALLQSVIDLELGVQARDWLQLFHARQEQLWRARKDAAAAIDAARIANAPPNRPLAEYAGHYRREGLDGFIEVTVDGHALHIGFNRGEYEARPWQYDTFLLVPQRLHTEDGVIEWPRDDDERSFVSFRMDGRGRFSQLATPFGIFERAAAAAD